MSNNAPRDRLSELLDAYFELIKVRPPDKGDKETVFAFELVRMFEDLDSRLTKLEAKGR